TAPPHRPLPPPRSGSPPLPVRNPPPVPAPGLLQAVSSSTPIPPSSLHCSTALLPILHNPHTGSLIPPAATPLPFHTPHTAVPTPSSAPRSTTRRRSCGAAPLPAHFPALPLATTLLASGSPGPGQSPSPPHPAPPAGAFLPYPLRSPLPALFPTAGIPPPHLHAPAAPASLPTPRSCCAGPHAASPPPESFSPASPCPPRLSAAPPPRCCTRCCSPSAGLRTRPAPALASPGDISHAESAGYVQVCLCEAGCCLRQDRLPYPGEQEIQRWPAAALHSERVDASALPAAW